MFNGGDGPWLAPRSPTVIWRPGPAHSDDGVHRRSWASGTSPRQHVRVDQTPVPFQKTRVQGLLSTVYSLNSTLSTLTLDKFTSEHSGNDLC